MGTSRQGQRNHKCDSCQKSFADSGNLKRHMKTIHEGFSTTGMLNQHIKKVHDNQKSL